MKIAILTPSRERPDKLYRLFESVNTTITKDTQIDFIVGVDLDDPRLDEYRNMYSLMLQWAWPNVRVKMIIDQRKKVSRIWNDLVKETDADWIMNGNDDMIFNSRGWDVIFKHYVDELKHPYHLFWFDDGINQDKNCAFPIVSKEWIKELGYFMSERFLYFFCETWIWDIAKRCGVAHYIDKVKLLHIHFAIDETLYDRTYHENRDDNQSKRDRVTFDLTDYIRETEAGYIKNKIKEHNDGK